MNEEADEPKMEEEEAEFLVAPVLDTEVPDLDMPQIQEAALVHDAAIARLLNQVLSDRVNPLADRFNVHNVLQCPRRHA